MRVLAVSLMILAGTASLPAVAGVSETLTQHHEWSRKFAPPSDPEVTGSIAAQPDIEVLTGPSDCPKGPLRFDNLPFERWRILRCEAQREEFEMKL